jgi:hypothetical protein
VSKKWVEKSEYLGKLPKKWYNMYMRIKYFIGGMIFLGLLGAREAAPLILKREETKEPDALENFLHARIITGTVSSLTSGTTVAVFKMGE